MSDARSDTYLFTMKKPFKVIVSLVTLVAFLCNTVSYDLAWAVNAPAALTSVGADRTGGPGSPKELRLDTFMMPANLGTVQYIQKADHGEAGTVIHIQDAHCNYPAQMKIAEIIGYLHDEYGIKTVNLEGGAKDYNLGVFTGIGDKLIREKVSDSFVSDGMVSGAEYFAINNPDKVMLWGIEDPKLYIQNLNVYKDSGRYKEVVDKELKALGHILSNLKIHIYEKPLLEFDTKYGQYKANNLPFKDYLAFLVIKAKESAISVKSFANIYLLSQTLEMEAAIDFKKANAERDELIDRLQKRLSKKSMEELIVKTVEFKSDRLSHKEYYAYLSGTAKSIGLDLAPFPMLAKYMLYISMYEAIDKMTVMAELEILEDGIRGALSVTEDQKELALLSKNLAILKNFFNISITRNDYEYYKHHSDSFAMARYTAFIDRMAPLYKIGARPDPNIGHIDRYRSEMAQFYEYSFLRDDAFIKNIKFAEDKLRTTIVVTGGFHTDNLRDLFKKRGISYISILPNFRSIDGYQSKYYSLLQGREDPVEKEIMAILPSALALASYLNDLGDLVRGRRGQMMLAIREKLREAGLAGKEGLILQNGDKRLRLGLGWNIIGNDSMDGNLQALDLIKLAESAAAPEATGVDAQASAIVPATPPAIAPLAPVTAPAVGASTRLGAGGAVLTLSLTEKIANFLFGWAGWSRWPYVLQQAFVTMFEFPVMIIADILRGPNAFIAMHGGTPEQRFARQRGLYGFIYPVTVAAAIAGYMLFSDPNFLNITAVAWLANAVAHLGYNLTHRSAPLTLGATLDDKIAKGFMEGGYISRFWENWSGWADGRVSMREILRTILTGGIRTERSVYYADFVSKLRYDLTDNMFNIEDEGSLLDTLNRNRPTWEEALMVYAALAKSDRLKAERFLNLWKISGGEGVNKFDIAVVCLLDYSRYDDKKMAELYPRVNGLEYEIRSLDSASGLQRDLIDIVSSVQDEMEEEEAKRPSPVAVPSQAQTSAAPAATWNVVADVFAKLETGRAVRDFVQQNNAGEILETMKQLFNVSLQERDITDVRVERFGDARQKEIYRARVEYVYEGKRFVKTFVIYTPARSAEYMQEENNLPRLNRIIPGDVIACGPIFVKNVDVGYGVKRVPLVMAEYVDGDNLYDICVKKNGDYSPEMVQTLQREAVRILLDIWKNSGGRLVLSDVTLGQFVYDTATGRVKLVDVGFLQNANSNPLSVFSYFGNVFSRPILGMEPSIWEWTTRSDKTEFFHGIYDSLGKEETRKFLEKVKDSLGKERVVYRYISEYLDKGIDSYKPAARIAPVAPAPAAVSPAMGAKASALIKKIGLIAIMFALPSLSMADQVETSDLQGYLNRMNGVVSPGTVAYIVMGAIGLAIASFLLFKFVKKLYDVGGIRPVVRRLAFGPVLEGGVFGYALYAASVSLLTFNGMGYSWQNTVYGFMAIQLFWGIVSLALHPIINRADYIAGGRFYTPGRPFITYARGLLYPVLMTVFSALWLPAAIAAMHPSEFGLYNFSSVAIPLEQYIPMAILIHYVMNGIVKSLKERTGIDFGYATIGDTSVAPVATKSERTTLTLLTENGEFRVWIDESGRHNAAFRKEGEDIFGPISGVRFSVLVGQLNNMMKMMNSGQAYPNMRVAGNETLESLQEKARALGLLKDTDAGRAEVRRIRDAIDARYVDTRKQIATTIIGASIAALGGEDASPDIMNLVTMRDLLMDESSEHIFKWIKLTLKVRGDATALWEVANQYVKSMAETLNRSDITPGLVMSWLAADYETIERVLLRGESAYPNVTPVAAPAAVLSAASDVASGMPAQDTARINADRLLDDSIWTPSDIMRFNSAFMETCQTACDRVSREEQKKYEDYAGPEYDALAFLSISLPQDLSHMVEKMFGIENFDAFFGLGSRKVIKITDNVVTIFGIPLASVKLSDDGSKLTATIIINETDIDRVRKLLIERIKTTDYLVRLIRENISSAIPTAVSPGGAAAGTEQWMFGQEFSVGGDSEWQYLKADNTMSDTKTDRVGQFVNGALVSVEMRIMSGANAGKFGAASGTLAAAAGTGFKGILSATVLTQYYNGIYDLDYLNSSTDMNYVEAQRDALSAIIRYQLKKWHEANTGYSPDLIRVVLVRGAKEDIALREKYDTATLIVNLDAIENGKPEIIGDGLDALRAWAEGHNTTYLGQAGIYFHGTSKSKIFQILKAGGVLDPEFGNIGNTAVQNAGRYLYVNHEWGLSDNAAHGDAGIVLRFDKSKMNEIGVAFERAIDVPDAPGKFGLVTKKQIPLSATTLGTKRAIAISALEQIAADWERPEFVRLGLINPTFTVTNIREMPAMLGFSGWADMSAQLDISDAIKKASDAYPDISGILPPAAPRGAGPSAPLGAAASASDEEALTIHREAVTAGVTVLVKDIKGANSRNMEKVAKGVAAIFSKLLIISGMPADISGEVAVNNSSVEGQFATVGRGDRPGNFIIAVDKMLLRKSYDTSGMTPEQKRQFDIDESGRKYDADMDEGKVIWILAHELAHLKLGHVRLEADGNYQEWDGGLEKEYAADALASQWLWQMGYRDVLDIMRDSLTAYYFTSPNDEVFYTQSLVGARLDYVRDRLWSIQGGNVLYSPETFSESADSYRMPIAAPALPAGQSTEAVIEAPETALPPAGPAVAAPATLETISPRTETITGVLKSNEKTGEHIGFELLRLGYKRERIKDALEDMILTGRAQRDPSGREAGIAFIKVPGLLAETRQFAHIGLGRTYGEPVIYIDEKWADNRTVRDHAIELVKLWKDAVQTDLKAEIDGQGPAAIRDWMRDHKEEAVALTMKYNAIAGAKYDIKKVASDAGLVVYQCGVEELLPDETPSIGAMLSTEGLPQERAEKVIEDEFERLASEHPEYFTLREYNEGDVFIKAGRDPGSMYYIVDGSAKVRFQDERELVDLGKGKIVGEIGVVSTDGGGAVRLRTATVTAGRGLKVLEITKLQYDRYIRDRNLKLDQAIRKLVEERLKLFPKTRSGIRLIGISPEYVPAIEAVLENGALVNRIYGAFKLSAEDVEKIEEVEYAGMGTIKIPVVAVRIKMRSGEFRDIALRFYNTRQFPNSKSADRDAAEEMKTAAMLRRDGAPVIELLDYVTSDEIDKISEAMGDNYALSSAIQSASIAGFSIGEFIRVYPSGEKNGGTGITREHYPRLMEAITYTYLKSYGRDLDHPNEGFSINDLKVVNFGLDMDKGTIRYLDVGSPFWMGFQNFLNFIYEFERNSLLEGSADEKSEDARIMRGVISGVQRYINDIASGEGSAAEKVEKLKAAMALMSEGLGANPYFDETALSEIREVVDEQIGKLEGAQMALGKGILVSVERFLQRFGIDTRTPFMENFMIPVIEEGLMALTLLLPGEYGIALYAFARILFVLGHVVQDRAPPLGVNRTLSEKIALPALYSVTSLAFLPLVVAMPQTFILIGPLLGLLAHITGNWSVDGDLRIFNFMKRAQKGVLGGAGEPVSVGVGDRLLSRSGTIRVVKEVRDDGSIVMDRIGTDKSVREEIFTLGMVRNDIARGVISLEKGPGTATAGAAPERDAVRRLVRRVIEDLRNGSRASLVGKIPGLTAKMEEAFRTGQIFILKLTDDQYFVSSSFGGETIAPKSWTKIGLPEEPSIEQKRIAYEVFEAWGKYETQFSEGDMDMAAAAFDREFGKRYGMQIKNAGSSGDIYYVMEILKLIPEGLLRSGLLKIIDFSAERDQGARFAQYVEDTDTIGIIANMIRFDRYMITGYLLHELGHPLMNGLDREWLAAFRDIYDRSIENGAVIGVSFMGMSREARIRYQASFDEFFAENFMHYLILGETGMLGPNDRNRPLRKALYDLYAGLYGPGVRLSRPAKPNEAVFSAKAATPGKIYEGEPVAGLDADEQRYVAGMVMAMRGDIDGAVKMLSGKVAIPGPEEMRSNARAYLSARSTEDGYRNLVKRRNEVAYRMEEADRIRYMGGNFYSVMNRMKLVENQAALERLARLEPGGAASGRGYGQGLPYRFSFAAILPLVWTFAGNPDISDAVRIAIYIGSILMLLSVHEGLHAFGAFITGGRILGLNFRMAGGVLPLPQILIKTREGDWRPIAVTAVAPVVGHLLIAGLGLVVLPYINPTSAIIGAIVASQIIVNIVAGVLYLTPLTEDGIIFWGLLLSERYRQDPMGLFRKMGLMPSELSDDDRKEREAQDLRAEEERARARAEEEALDRARRQLEREAASSKMTSLPLGKPGTPELKDFEEVLGTGVITWDTNVYAPTVDGESLKLIREMSLRMDELRRTLLEPEKRRVIRILVVGCGTGVDVIAAIRKAKSLGYDVVLDAIDVNPAAVGNTEENIRLYASGVIDKARDSVNVAQVNAGKELDALKGSYDMVLFNSPDPIVEKPKKGDVAPTQIGVLTDLMGRIAGRIAPGGILVMRSRMNIADMKTLILPGSMSWELPEGAQGAKPRVTIVGRAAAALPATAAGLIVRLDNRDESAVAQFDAMDAGIKRSIMSKLGDAARKWLEEQLARMQPKPPAAAPDRYRGVYKPGTVIESSSICLEGRVGFTRSDSSGALKGDEKLLGAGEEAVSVGVMLEDGSVQLLETKELTALSQQLDSLYPNRIRSVETVAGKPGVAMIRFKDATPDIKMPIQADGSVDFKRLGNYIKYSDDMLPAIVNNLRAHALTMRPADGAEGAERNYGVSLQTLAQRILLAKWSSRKVNGKAEPVKLKTGDIRPEAFNVKGAKAIEKVLMGMANGQAKATAGTEAVEAPAAPAAKSALALFTAAVKLRMSQVIEAMVNPNNKDQVVFVVMGVPQGQNPESFNDINRALLDHGYGIDGQKREAVKTKDSHLVTYQIVEGDEAATIANEAAAIKRAMDRLKADGIHGRVVVFSREAARMLTAGDRTAFEGYHAKDENITVVPDAYRDLDTAKKIFPDLMARVALARNIAYHDMTQSADERKRTIEVIRSQLQRIADDSDGIFKIENGRIRFIGLLKIRPIDFGELSDWRNTQEAVAMSA